MPAKSTTYTRTLTFEGAQRVAGDGYVNPALLAELNSSWFYVGEPRLTDLPDFFGPFFAAMAIARARDVSRGLRVLDFGGSTGRYRAYVDAFFGQAIRTDWHVVETALYADHAKKAPVAGVTVHASIDDVAAEHDLAVFSGSLQYLADWQQVLAHPTIQRAPMIYIARTPLGEAEIPFLQSIEYDSGTVNAPCRVIPRPELTAILSKTHDLFSSMCLPQYVGPLGTFDAPAMIWRRREVR